MQTYFDDILGGITWPSDQPVKNFGAGLSYNSDSWI